MNGWGDFFVATAGAAAALAGLIIVAISVNVARILEYRQLPTLAAAAIASLVGVLVLALAGLAPQPTLAFGIEATAIGASLWIIHSRSAAIVVRANRATRRPRVEAARVVVSGQVQSITLAVGAVLILTGVAAGPYVLLGGIAAVFALTMFEAWVLLIEILR